MMITYFRPAVSGSIVVALVVAVSWSSNPIVGGTSARAQPLPSSARAGHRSCSERRSLHSIHSREPTKITFVNKSGMYRAFIWVDFNGTPKNYGGMNSGETKTFSTYRTHPWMVTDGPGNCIEIILPAAEQATVILK